MRVGELGMQEELEVVVENEILACEFNDFILATLDE